MTSILSFQAALHVTHAILASCLSSSKFPKHSTQIPPFSSFFFFSNSMSLSSPKSRQMSNDPITIHLLCAVFLGSTSYTFLAYYIGRFSASIYLLAAMVVVVVLAVVFARVVVVVCITVLVLLTIAGNRRCVLVREGNKITADIGSCLIKRVLINERNGAFTIAIGAIVSLLAMAGLVETMSSS